MTNQKQVRIDELTKARAYDIPLYHSRYGLTIYGDRSLKNITKLGPPRKDFYTCLSCIHSYSRTCEKHKNCTSCPQYLKSSVETKTSNTNCLCNTVEYGTMCPYYKVYHLGYSAKILFTDEIFTKKEKENNGTL